MLGSLGNGASLLLIPDSSSESGDQTRQNHPRVRWSGLQSTHPQESTQETGRSEQPQGECGAPISQMRKLRLSGKEGTPAHCSLGGRTSCVTSSRSPPPGSPHPLLMRGWNPRPFSTHCIGGGDERKHSGPRSLPRAALAPGLPRGVTACAGSCPCSLQVQPHTSPPPPSAGLGNKSSRSCPARGPQAWPGSERLPPQPDLGRSRPASRTGARRPHWPPTRAWEGGFGPGRPPPPPLLF